MSKLLSDEELIEEISSISIDTETSIIDEYKPLLDLINTQKRLYAESVIGELENEADNPMDMPRELIRNELRAEQRARISQ